MDDKVKVITINDGGIDKRFAIHKMGAFKLVKFNHKLIGTLDGLRDLSDTDKANIKQLIFIMLKTGETVPGANLESINYIDILSILFNMIRGMLTTDDNLQDDLFAIIFDHVNYYNDGVNPLKLSTNPNSPLFIDHHINEMETVYKLCWEQLKLDYAKSIQNFLQKWGKTNSQEALKTN